MVATWKKFPPTKQFILRGVSGERKQSHKNVIEKKSYREVKCV